MPETLMELAAIMDYTQEAALLCFVGTKLFLNLQIPLKRKKKLSNNKTFHRQWLSAIPSVSILPQHGHRLVGQPGKLSSPKQMALSSAHFLSFPYIMFFNNQRDLHRDNIQKF